VRFAVAGFAAILLLGAAALAGDAHEVQHLAATVVAIDRTSITIAPSAPGGPGRRPPLVFSLTPDTVKIHQDERDFDGVHSKPAAMADLHVGQSVVVTPDHDSVLEIRILAPTPVTGIIVAAGPKTLTVRSHIVPNAPVISDAAYTIVPERTKITLMPVLNGPVRNVERSGLKSGQSVAVTLKGDVALTIRVMPSPTTAGMFMSISDGTVTIKLPAPPGGAEPARRRFSVDPLRLEVFAQYYGEPATPTPPSELQPGQTVAVSHEGEAATAITVLHPGTFGKIAEVGRVTFTVLLRSDDPSTPAAKKTFRVDDRTQIFLGKEDHSEKLRSGKTRHFWRYLPGGHFSDLAPGELVSITAKDDYVRSMRVTPQAGKKSEQK
jgi:hypothetical protein